jgi:hypothetical protein
VSAAGQPAAQVVHPDVLSDEDGEQMWVREDLVPGGEEELIRDRIKRAFGLGDEEVECYGEPELCEMRRAADTDTDWQVEEGWYLPVLEGQQTEVRYWRVTV